MTAHFEPDGLPMPVLTYSQAQLLRHSYSYDEGLTRFVAQGPADRVEDFWDMVNRGLIKEALPFEYELTDDGLVVYARLTRTKG